MLITSLVFNSLCFVLTSIAIHTHWFVQITVGTTKMNVGPLLADFGDDVPTPVFIGQYCSKLTLNTTSSTCTDYETLSSALYLVWGVSLIFLIVSIVAAILHMRVGLIMLVLALTFQSAACFGFFFRVMGLQKQVAADHFKASVTEWAFGWPAILGGVSIILNWVATIIFAVTFCPPEPAAPATAAPGAKPVITANAAPGGAQQPGSPGSPNATTTNSTSGQQQQMQQQQMQQQQQQSGGDFGRSQSSSQFAPQQSSGNFDPAATNTSNTGHQHPQQQQQQQQQPAQGQGQVSAIPPPPPPPPPSTGSRPPQQAPPQHGYVAPQHQQIGHQFQPQASGQY